MFSCPRLWLCGTAVLTVALFPLAGLLPGCGGSGAPSGQTLAPGSMELVAVTPVAASGNAPAENLLRNGDFREFWAGAPAPTGFTLPGADGASRVRRGVGHKDRAGSNFSAVQTWDRPDAGMGLTHRFGTQVTGLKPATAYRVEVVADGSVGVLASIGAFQSEGDDVVELAPRVLPVTGGIGLKSFVGHFVSQRGGNHTLTSLLASAENMPATVTWYDWRLTEVPGDAAKAEVETRLRDRDARGMLVNWQLRQLAEVAARFNGHEAWSGKVAPFVENLRETLKLVEDTGTDVFEGEDGFLFSRFDSSFLLETDLVYTEEGRFTQAVGAILDFNRQLANQGINLMVAPVPVRSVIYPEKLAPGTDPHLLVAPQVVRLMQLLNRLDVEAIDMLDYLRKASQNNLSIYLRTEAQLTSAAIARIARLLVTRLERYEFLKSADTPRADYQSANKPVKWRGSLVKELPTDKQAAHADEAQAIAQVLDGQGNLFQPPAKSMIAVMGDVAADYAEEGASLVAHLSKELRFPVALLPVQDPGPGAPRKLADLGPNALDGIRVLIWIVPMNYFCPSESYTWESMPEY